MRLRLISFQAGSKVVHELAVHLPQYTPKYPLQLRLHCPAPSTERPPVHLKHFLPSVVQARQYFIHGSVVRHLLGCRPLTLRLHDLITKDVALVGTGPRPTVHAAHLKSVSSSAQLAGMVGAEPVMSSASDLACVRVLHCVSGYPASR